MRIQSGGMFGRLIKCVECGTTPTPALEPEPEPVPSTPLDTDYNHKNWRRIFN